MSISFARALVRAALTFAIAVPATVCGTAVANAATPRLALTALSFEQSTVDARSDYVANKLTWTVTNTDRDADSVFGTVTMQARSRMTGKLIGHDRVTRYAFGQTCCEAEFVSGTPQESTYSYYLPVRRYADAATTTWEVTNVTIGSDNVTTSVSGAKLRSFHGYRFTARTLIDSTGPTVDSITIGGQHAPYFYVKDEQATVFYDFSTQDAESGFWKGTIKLAGPAGQKASTDFTWEREEFSTGLHCGAMTGGDESATYMSCSIGVVLPKGAAAGRWLVSSLVLDNNAGTRATYKDPAAPPVTATSNATVRASDFAVSPNPVDNWRDDVIVELSMSVTGAKRGVSSVQVDFGFGCIQWGTASTNAAGRVAVPVRVFQTYAGCAVNGIAVVDGAGNAALYGSEFGAPDPHVSISQIPSTEPPTALGATLDPPSLTVSELADHWVTFSVRTKIGVAPINDCSIYIYNADSRLVFQSTGNGTQAADGTITNYLSLGGWGLEPGAYRVGFSLSDAAHHQTYYDTLDFPINSQPIPGGPLIFTITEG